MVLLMEAACEGLIDFSKQDRYDRRWQAKLSWTLNYLERRSRLRINDTIHRQRLAALASAGAEQASELFEKAEQIRQEMIGDLRPHLRKEFDPTTLNQRLERNWIAAYGDPKDPEVQRRIDTTVDFLLNPRT